MAELLIDPLYRGPDDSGLFADDHAVLGHRRLSIVDLSTGHQPLGNEDDTIWIVYNGEIYNHADIRKDLEARGHRYKTKSDTESIVHAYEEWGDDCVHRFRGMFGAGPLVAAPWVPRPDTAAREFVWCALDCPGAYACGATSRGTLLLGRLAARVLRVPEPGERCVVAGWQLGAEGRKLEAGTALWSAGELLGYARATWIEPRT